MKHRIITILSALALASSLFTGCSSTEPNNLTAEQIAAAAMVDRSTNSLGSEELDKQGRFLTTEWFADINADKSLRSLKRAGGRTEVGSNLGADGVGSFELLANQSEHFGGDDGESYGVPVGFEVRVAALDRSHGDGIAEQITGNTARDTARYQGIATWQDAQGRSHELLVNADAAGRVNTIAATADLVTGTINSATPLVGQILSVNPIVAAGNLASQGITLLKPDGQQETVTVVAPTVAPTN